MYAILIGCQLAACSSTSSVVDDRGGEAGVGEGLSPLGERCVGGDRHGCPLLTLGPPADAGIPRSEHLEEQFGSARVEVDVAELVEAEMA